VRAVEGDLRLHMFRFGLLREDRFEAGDRRGQGRVKRRSI
jgi:hypothetical protein